MWPRKTGGLEVTPLIFSPVWDQLQVVAVNNWSSEVYQSAPVFGWPLLVWRHLVGGNLPWPNSAGLSALTLKHIGKGLKLISILFTNA